MDNRETINGKDTFKKHYSRFVAEGLIKAVICAVIVGFSLSFFATLVIYFTAPKMIWIPIVIGVVMTGGSAPLFWLWLFRPKAKRMAERIDRLGLEERLITMMELEKDSSYVALRQREDAKANLNRLNRKNIRFSIFKVPLAVAIVAFVFSVTAIAVTGLSAFGAIKLPDWIDPNNPGGGEGPETEIEYVKVVYNESLGGTVEGDVIQFVARGENAEPVWAIADPGFAFDIWSDGVASAQRIDAEVMEDFSVTAYFVMLVDGEGEPGDGEGEDDPLVPGEEPGDGQSNENKDDDRESSGAGGAYNDDNYIIDDNTHYLLHLQDYYEEAMRILSEGGSLSPEMRAIIQAYFDSLGRQ